ncbi:MAG: gluconate 2-dehydrogenase subunit 3 family protein [Cyclobacteriaceae bacterium]|jgi:hypothetical protein|nr:gluconate 2-dehydrogenase subunit 3 family protein [Cyclobacteriaceae bacterium]
MDRREVLKNLALLTGGAMLVPSCNFSKEDILSAYNNLQITPSLHTLLAGIADTIIPAGNLKGAADLNVQDFILVMVNDCLPADQQQTFSSGLASFNDWCKKTGGSTFGKLSSEKKTEVILTGLSLDEKSEDETVKSIRTLLRITKRFTIQGFMMSEYIMTEVKPYKIIPGNYNGAVLLTDLNNETIHG